MICPNFSDEKVTKKFKKLQKAVGETEAYNVWNKNRGFPSEETPYSNHKGRKSELFEKNKEMFGENEAIRMSNYIKSDKFKSMHGDWEKNPSSFEGNLLDNGEPDLIDLLNRSFSKEVSTELSEEQKEELEAYNKYNISGLTVEEVDDFIGSMMFNLLLDLETEESVYKVSLYRKTEKKVEKILEKYKAKRETDNYKNNKAFKKKLDEKIRKVELLTKEENKEKYRRLFQETAAANDIQVTTKNEKGKSKRVLVSEQWDDSAKLKISSKDTSRARAKSLLSGIPISKISYDGIETGVYEKTFFGEAKKHSMEFMISLLNKEFENKKIDNESQMMDLLKDSSFGQLNMIGKILSNPNLPNINQMRSLIKNAFTMNSNNMQKTLLGKSTSGKKIHYLPRIIEANRNAVENNIYSRWVENGKSLIEEELNRDDGIYRVEEVDGIEHIYYNEKTFVDFENRVKKAMRLKKNKIEELTNIYAELVNRLGMNMNRQQIAYFLRNDYKFINPYVKEKNRIEEGESFIPYKPTAKGVKSPLGTLFNTSKFGKDLNNDNNEGNFNKNNVLNDKAIKKVLTSVHYYTSTDSPILNFRNSNNDIVSEYTLPTHNQMTFNDLKHKGKIFKMLSESDYYKDNYLFDALEENPDLVDFATYDAMVPLRSGKKTVGGSNDITSVTKNKMNNADRIMNSLNAVANQNRDAFWFDPSVFADKSKVSSMKLPRLKFVLGKDIKLKYDNESNKLEGLEIDGHLLEHFRKAIRNETNRINRVIKNKDSNKKSALYKGGHLYFLFPKLNSLLNTSSKEEIEMNEEFDTIVDEVITESLKGDFNDMLEKIRKEGLDEKVAENSSKTTITYLDSEYARSLLSNDKRRLGKNYKDGENMKLFALSDYVLNYKLGQITFTQTLGGDPAEYFKYSKEGDSSTKRTWENYFKRMGGAAGTSTRGNYTYRKFDLKASKKDGKLVESRKDTFEKIATLNIKDPETNREAKKWFDHNYKGVEMADAQEFITVREFATNKYSQGNLSDHMFESIMNKIERSYERGDHKYDLTKEQIEALDILPQKPLYFGYAKNEEGARLTFVKSSAMTLTPGLTQSHEMDKVRIAMEKLEYEINKDEWKKKDRKLTNVRAALGTAIKVGADNITTIHDDIEGDEPDIKDDLSFTEADVNYLDRNNFGIQQEEIAHDNYETVTVTQMNKLLFSGLIEVLNDEFYEIEFEGTLQGALELKRTKEDIRKKIMKLSEENLHKELEFEDGEFKNIEKLKKKIVEHMTGEVNMNDLNYLTIEDGKFKFPLSFSPIFNQVISSLQSIIYKNVIKQKMPGYSAAQGSSFGTKITKEAFEEFDNKSDIIYSKKHINRSKKENTRGLQFFRKGDKKGDKYKSVQVVVSWPFSNKDGMLDVEDFTTTTEEGIKYIDPSKLPDSLLETIGARIPNQSQSSMTPIEIVGFLPPKYKGLVLLPGEITRQTGSDFDIDHLYSYMYNFEVSKDSITIEDIDNLSILDTKVKKRQNETTYDEEGKEVLIKDLKDYDEAVTKSQIASENQLYVNDEKVDIWYDSITDKYYIKNGIKLNKVEDNDNSNIRSLKNRYIKLHRDVLLDSKVMKKTTEPLDMKDGEDIANEIRDLKDSADSKEFNPLGFRHIDKEYIANQGGKEGIAILSSASTLLADMENLGITISNPIEIEVNGEKLTLDTFGIGYYDNGKRSNKDSVSILQSESVDNANNKNLDDLGFHSIMASAIQGLLYLKDSSQKDDSNNTATLRYLSNLLNTSIVKDLINETSKSLYQGNNTTLDKVIKEKRRKLKKRVISEDITLSIDDFKDMIKNPKLDHTDIEYSILGLIEKLDEIGKYFMYVNMVRGAETSGFGKNMNSSLTKQQVYNTFIAKNGSRVKESPIENLHYLFERPDGSLTELGYIYEKGIKANINTWNSNIKGQRIVNNNSPLMKGIHKEINNILGKDKDYLLEEDFNKITRGVRSYFFSSIESTLYDKPIIEEYNDLVLDSKKPDSLLNRIKQFREENRTAGAYLINSLEHKTTKYTKYIEKGKGNLKFESRDIVEIGFNVDRLTATSKKKYIGSFIELLTSSDPFERNLGRDLIKYNFLVGGNTNFKSYNNIIPSEYLAQKGFTNYLNNINYEIESNKDINRVGEIATQILENNIEMLPHFSNVRSNTLYSNKSGDVFIKVEKGKNIKDAPLMVRNGSYVYKRESNESTTYRRVKSRQVVGNIKYFNADSSNKDFSPFKNKDGSGMSVVNKTPKNFTDIFVTDTKGKVNKARVIEGMNKLNKEGFSNLIKKSAGLIVKLQNEIPEQFSLEIDSNLGARGVYSNGEARINPTRFNSKEGTAKEKTSELQRMIIHETLHSIDSRVLKNYDAGRLEKGTPLYNRIEDLHSLLKILNKAVKEDSKYGEFYEMFETSNKKGKGTMSISAEQDVRLKEEGIELNNLMQPLENVDEFLVGIRTDASFLNMLKEIDIEIFENELRGADTESLRRIKNYYRELIKKNDKNNKFSSVSLDMVNDFYMALIKETTGKETKRKDNTKETEEKVKIPDLVKGQHVQFFRKGKEIKGTILKKSDSGRFQYFYQMNDKHIVEQSKYDPKKFRLLNTAAGYTTIENKKYLKGVDGEFYDLKGKHFNTITDKQYADAMKRIKEKKNRDAKKELESIKEESIRKENDLLFKLDPKLETKLNNTKDRVKILSEFVRSNKEHIVELVINKDLILENSNMSNMNKGSIDSFLDKIKDSKLYKKQSEKQANKIKEDIKKAETKKYEEYLKEKNKEKEASEQQAAETKQTTEEINQPQPCEFSGRQFEIKNLFSVKQTGSSDMKKDSVKASIATKYIGFGGGKAGMYAKQAGIYANVGSYSARDAVFVSINDDVSDADFKATVNEIYKALDAGSYILTDSNEYIDKSTYNNGAKKLRDWLNDSHAVYKDFIIEGQSITYWEYLPFSKALTLETTQEQEKEIEKLMEDCIPFKAKRGLNNGFKPGKKWRKIKEFKGKSHAQGGIDISIGNKGIRMSNKNGSIEAKNGLLIDNKNISI